MKFLIDQQLPSRLAEVLNEPGHEAVHVKHLGLMRASDFETAARARIDGAAIVTKDDDFISQIGARGRAAQVVHIREVWRDVEAAPALSKVVEAWPKASGRP